MKKFIFKICLFCFLVSFCLGSIAMVNHHWFMNDLYLYEFPVKQRLIAGTPSPKVVVLGGSNVAFGIDSRRMADSLHLPVVNAGLHAGLGLKFIMDANTPLLRKGDVLVIMPEYDHFSGTLAYGEQTTSGAVPYFATCSEMFNMNMVQKMMVIKGFCMQTPQTLLAGLKTAFTEQQENVYQYKKSGFNSLGDEVSHLCLPSDVDMKSYTVAVNKNEFNDAFFQEFVADVRALRQRGVVVKLLPPAILDKCYQLDAAYILRLREKMKQVGIPYQAPSEVFAYPVDMLYNSNYHLNKEGVEANTENVIRYLNR